jgi:heat shock protein HtpX
MNNTLKTGILLVIMTLLFMYIGKLIGGLNGMIIAFFIAVVMNIGSYWFSDKIALGYYNAQPISEQEAPELYSMVRRLTVSANLPMPRLYVIPGNVANAFATGRNPQNAAVAVTEGLLHILDRDEVEGVIAHELAHVKNRDILISAIAATFAGAIMMIANLARFGMMISDSDDNRGVNPIALLVTIIVGPIAAAIIQMAISRSREYQADAYGAQISGNPNGLANALEKLQQASSQTQSYGNAETAHMFIVNPLKGGISGLFSTHPPMEERIARLRSMASGINQR